MARRFLVSKGVVANPRPWQDPPPPNTHTVSESQFRELFPGLREAKVDYYAEPATEPPKKRGRPRKAPVEDLFTDPKS